MYESINVFVEEDRCTEDEIVCPVSLIFKYSYNYRARTKIIRLKYALRFQGG